MTLSLSLPAFLEQFGSLAQRRIAELATDHYLVAYHKAGESRLTCAALDDLHEIPDNAVSTYSPPMGYKSRTQQAIDLVEGGMTAYAAAKELGLSQSAISRALVRRTLQGTRCPTCGRLLATDPSADPPESLQINRRSAGAP